MTTTFVSPCANQFFAHTNNIHLKLMLGFSYPIMHCIWTLPDGDADFSTRWNVIKRGVTRRVGARLQRADLMNESKAAHRESTLWQRRFWEHQIRDDADYQAYMDYIHFNPVKHGVVERLIDWPHSSFHRAVASGVYPLDWVTPPDSSLIGGEAE